MAATTVHATRTCSEIRTRWVRIATQEGLAYTSYSSHCLEANANIYRPWNDETVSRAYEVLLEELDLPPSAPGGKVEFRRSLTLSFLFRFNLEVLQKLREMVGDACNGLFFSC